MPNATISFQTLDGPFEVGGIDRRRGIVPENLTYSSDSKGSTKASFDLKRDPGVVWPDLRAFTPVDIEVDGVLVWSGFVKETPSKDGVQQIINVQAAGWQYHLDEDAFRKVYVQTDLSAWKDTRSMLDTPLASAFRAAYTVANDNGIITLTYPKGTAWNVGSNWVGVTLDLGPYQSAASISMDWESSADTGGAVTVYARSSSVSHPAVGGSFSDALAFAHWTASLGTSSGNFSLGYRYVHIFMYHPAGSAGNYGADHWFRIKGVRVYTNSAYRSGDASVLRAHHVAIDAFTYAPLLNRDQAGIQQTSFNIPEYAPDAPVTLRDHLEAVNAFHDYQYGVDVRRRPIFRPQPSVPALEIGAWSSAEVEDASANSGDEIYNHAVITGTGPDGTPVEVHRYQETGDAQRVESARQFANPSFEVDASSWAAIQGSISRVTSGQHSGAGALSASAGSVFEFEGQFTAGTFTRGRLYIMRWFASSSTTNGSNGYRIYHVRLRRSGSPLPIQTLSGTSLGTYPTGNGTFISYLSGYNGNYLEGTILWAPDAATDASTLRFHVISESPISSGLPMRFDSFQLMEAIPTLPDRAGRVRTKILPVSASLTEPVAQQIGDTYLAGHRATPFKGSVTAVGSSVARDPLTGRPIPAAQLPLYGGELLRLGDRIDPDTGAIGRDVRIAEVTYDQMKDQATISLDNSRKNFEAYLERLQLVSRQVKR